MEYQEILRVLQQDIHMAVVATSNDDGIPATSVVDILHADDNGLYFLTTRGNNLHERLLRHSFIALAGIRGGDPLSAISVSLRGHVKALGKLRLDEFFGYYPYLSNLYPDALSRDVLEVFQVDRAEGELCDLSRRPVMRESFAYGGGAKKVAGYRIIPELCIGCRNCLNICPRECITNSLPRSIETQSCDQCGKCFHVCPTKAVEKT